jgi:hypothetical protein
MQVARKKELASELSRIIHCSAMTKWPVNVYWRLWLGVVAVALVLRFTVFLGANSNRLFALAAAYFIVTWLSIIVLNSVEGRTLMSHLRTHHHDKWEWLTYAPGLGPGMHNSFRSLPWLYSADDLGDPVVASMKKRQRGFLRWALTVFFSYIIIMPVLLGF